MTVLRKKRGKNIAMKVAIESSVHRHEPINSGPVHTYSGFRQHASGEFDSESGYFKVRSPE